MTAETNKAVMRRFVEFINTGSEKLADELISPNAIFHVPGRAEPMRGPAGYLAIIGMMRGGFPDIQWTLEEMIAENDKVAARFTMRGTHLGHLPRRTANRQDNCGAGYEFLSSVRRAIRRGTRSTGFAWVSSANWRGADTGCYSGRMNASSNSHEGVENMIKVWFITGAGRGMGVDIAKAALAAGNKVVATGRKPDKVAEALGKSADLLVVPLDITKPADAEVAVKAAVDKFGRLDVLVNNAANFYAGFFEELTSEQMERQLSTSLVGPMNVTRAILPVMRKQRSGLIITISSTAGLIGFEFGTAYAASKFGLEGWMQSLQAEVEPFGINTITVNPGFFRTELLTEESTNFAERTIEDYDERRTKQMEFWKGYNGQQSGDPAKLAQALITISGQEKPPVASLQAQTPLAPQSKWPQPFGSRLKPTVSCPLPSHSIRRSRV